MKNFKTEQEKFWAGEFGDNYLERNQGEKLLASNLNFFTKALSRVTPLSNCIEFGANIGMNLKALILLMPALQVTGIELHEGAAKKLSEVIGEENVYNGSIYDYPVSEKFELAFIKGVLIHINPTMLPQVYDKLYNASLKYILIAEYYNPSPVTINYRGHEDRLFKRDFAGEMLDQYSDLKLIDYGFAYKRDVLYPQDDITWFLLEKK
ncbi:MAG: pseudaminic acid biosynthesis-associated methylase [Niastella sp.]|nr:pseudaminic acid biosynthesis-associated methylase [Niastella sp.]